MKKILALVLACCLLLGGSVALAESSDTVHLTLWTFQELDLQFYKEMLAEYNAQTKGPKLDIDMQCYPYEDMHNKLTIALQTGEGAPDISDIEVNMFANYLKGTPGSAHVGYSRQWWVGEDGRVAALGIFGQMIWISPKDQLVVASVASWPDYIEPNRRAAMFRACQAIGNALNS